MLRTVNDPSTLWDSVLPAELLVLPARIGAGGCALDDPVFLQTVCAVFSMLGSVVRRSQWRPTCG